jgi:hypothetical protein
VWTLHDGGVYQMTENGPVGLERSGLPEEEPGLLLHIGRVLLGLAVLFVPGVLLLPKVLRDATLADALGLVPALGLALASVIGVIVLAVMRAPFSGSLAWMTALATCVLAFILRIGPRRQAT